MDSTNYCGNCPGVKPNEERCCDDTSLPCWFPGDRGCFWAQGSRASFLCVFICSLQCSGSADAAKSLALLNSPVLGFRSYRLNDIPVLRFKKISYSYLATDPASKISTS